MRNPQCSAVWFVAGQWAAKTGSDEYNGRKCRREATHDHAGHPCCWVHFMAAKGPRAETKQPVRFEEP